jgi:4,5-dihydroxyphthalate decarboxylase
MPEDEARLSAAVATRAHTRAVKEHRIGTGPYRLEFIEVDPIIAAFRRMIRSLEFDVCELAPTTYLAAREAGVPITAVPVFLTRRFHHGDVVCRPGSGIRTPLDLAGRRVGVRAYTVSTGVWARGILQSEYGVDPDSITWVVDDEEHVTSFGLPPNVEHTPPGESIAQQFHDGRIDAALTGPAGIGRAGAPKEGWSIAGAGFADARQESEIFYPLFPGARALEADWYQRTGVYPIHGLIAIKADVADRNPGLPAALLTAFTQAKKLFLEELAAGTGSGKDFTSYGELREIVGPDPLPYGIEANEKTLTALIDYALSQHIITAKPDLEELFA